jgi:hypothetical protein
LDYTEGQPIPPGYSLRTEARATPLIIGGIAFWAGYGASSAIAWIGVRTQCELQGKLANCDEGLGYYPLNVPFAGPFISLATLDLNAGEAVGLISLGALQIAGVGVFIAALARPKKELVKTTGALSLKLAPIVGADGLGLRMTGAL